MTATVDAGTIEPNSEDGSDTSPDVVTTEPTKRPPLSGGRMIVVSALLLLAATTLGFVATLVGVSQVQHARDQEVVYSSFRYDLANAIATVGQTDVSGQILAMGAPVAVLLIPEIGVQEVVLNGTTSTVMQSGPALRRDTVLPGQPGNSVIYGRQASYGGPFSDLSQLQPGSVIQAITGQGEHEYSVISVRRAGDPLPPPREPGQGRLTLVTADGPRYLPSDILRVDAVLRTEPVPVPQMILGPLSLSPSEQPMAGDPDGLVPMILWGQLLVVAVVAAVWLGMSWGKWQAWIIAAPVIAFAGINAATAGIRLLPNLM
ncbi:MAG: sortase [Candidatus Nanopelagicales bacterium]|nr:sortase [Candidatus Nanopelagicales bacterium]